MKLRGITKGVGGSAVEGVAGVIAFYAHRMLSQKVTGVQKHPLLAPGGILVLGHVLKKNRRFAGVGTALCGIAGYAGAQVFELQKATTQANTPAAAGTAGFGDDDDDTGALVSASDIGALVSASDIGAFESAASAYDDAYTL
jgi:hypothetical protein